MTINVRLSASLARLAGSSHLWLTLAQEATVADLFHHLRTHYPALDSKLNIAVAIISGRHTSPSQPLHDGDQVAILIPIAGG